MSGGEPLGGPRDGPDFQNLHRNKRAITLNLKAPEGVAAFKRLVKKADVVVENFRPDVKDRLGIDYETLTKINPAHRLCAAFPASARTGLTRDRPGFDQIAQGMGGLMSITGLPGQGPVRVGIPIADLCARAVLRAWASWSRCSSAKNRARASGCTTSLLQAQIFMLDFQAARWLMKGEVPQQAGNDHPTSIPTGVFKTADGHINIAATGAEDLGALCEAIGAPELIEQAGLRDRRARSKNRDALNAEIDKPSRRQRTSAEWIETSQQGRRAVAGRSIPSTRCSPIRRCKHLGMAAQASQTQGRSR